MYSLASGRSTNSLKMSHVFTWYSAALLYIFSDWYLYIILCILFLGSTLLCSAPSGTELRGNAVICPGNSGIFECKTTNTEKLFWLIDGSTILFTANHRVEDSSIKGPGYVASLVELNLTSGNIGNRISLLRVAPATTDVNISVTCSGGDPVNTCNRDIDFIGNCCRICQLAAYQWFMVKCVMSSLGWLLYHGTYKGVVLFKKPYSFK